MARRIQLRRDTAANWSATNPTLAQGEIGFDLTNNKIKIGTGSTVWNSLPYFDDKETVLSNYAGHIVPSADNTYDLGAPDKQWRHVYTAGGSIYLDNIKLTNVNGKFTATKVINPGEENEEEDPEDSDATSEIRGGSISVGTGTGPSIENVTEILINGTVTEIEPGLVGISVTGEGLPSITVPATPKVLYKGLEASYGVVHSNGEPSELNVNKIVIYKPATTTVTIDPTGSNDDFQVSGLGSSDVLAMFIVYGDTNGAKPLTALQNFTQAVIDNVILLNGVEGDFNTVDEMKDLFYANYATLATAAGGLHTNFEFYQSGVPTLNGGPTTVREGSGAVFEIANAGNGTYAIAGTLNPGTNYRAGHKIKVLGTDLGGVTPDNDCIITLGATGENGGVFMWSVSGTAAGSTVTVYSGVSGTAYQSGSGFTVSDVFTNGVNVSNYGSGYVVGDVITLLGENITGGTTPTNNITIITINSVGANGEAFDWSVSGIRPDVWPTNSISDGGEDQYDTANYINTNLANEINYNGGNTVEDGTAAFGAGSIYSFVYDTAIFGLFVVGNGATSISTSGNSGADGGSITETGSMFGAAVPEQTFDNAVTHINIIGGEEVDGIRFSDNTFLTSAEGIGRVKLESPGGRRIEEVYGYKSVGVTSRNRQEITGATYTTVNAYELRVKKSTEVDAFISPYYNTGAVAVWYISFDNTTFRPATFNSDGGDNWMFYYDNANNSTSQVEDAPFYIRRDVGGDPVVWWDSADLPGGSTNFRGAIIKYHAYITDSGSMVGTIHIAKDSGDNNIFHTEVLSGGTDGENAVLWYQDNENQIKYKRIDGESSVVKIQWSATVFYGSEVWD